MKEMYCTGYSHLDLSNNNIENVAIYYLENDIAFNSKEMVTLKHSIRFDIKDNSCPASPLFTANDISHSLCNTTFLTFKTGINTLKGNYVTISQKQLFNGS